MVNIFCHQHGVASSKLKQNAAVTRARWWISGLHFLVCITHPTRSWMRAELCLDHVEVAQGSSLHRILGRSSYAFKCHAVDESSPHCGKLTVDSFYMLLEVYYSLLPATSMVSWLRYTLPLKGSARCSCPGWTVGKTLNYYVLWTGAVAYDWLDLSCELIYVQYLHVGYQSWV